MSSFSNTEEESSYNLPNIAHEMHWAKTYLQKHCPEFGDNLYDHLSELLAKILSEHPKNALASFEEYSRKLKEERFKTQTGHLRDVYVPPTEYENAKKLIDLFQTDDTIKETDEQLMSVSEDDDTRQKPPNLMELFYYFEQVGVGLPRCEIILLDLSIRKLIKKKLIKNVRFWGKIIGNPKNYYIIEADLQDEELEHRLEQLEEEEWSKREKENMEMEEATALNKKETNSKAPEVEVTSEILETKINDDNKMQEKNLKYAIPHLPENLSKTSMEEIPTEILGSGANSKIYFVCNSPGLDDWVELPLVTPQQIIVARQIVHYFTGNLNNPINTYPPFPGTEKNYLRAQVARISAATLISPVGFFTFSGEEKEDIEEEEKTESILQENINYELIPVEDLIDPSMSNWCHHSPYLLEQGRVVRWDPKNSVDNNERNSSEEEIEEMKKNEDDEGIIDERKEAGPSLLIPLSNDTTIDSVPPWSVRKSSRTRPETAVALVRSNVWPGAFAFATERIFGNIYIGWGRKDMAYKYIPDMPQMEDQYKFVTEMNIHGSTFEGEGEYIPISSVDSISINREKQYEENAEEEENVEQEISKQENENNGKQI